jgi:glucose-6-phosphate 1-dehydrogenase
MADGSDMMRGSMDELEQLDELLICHLDEGRRSARPCTIIIFGASGDLTFRKLIPALYHLFLEKQMPNPFQVIGVARREKTDASWREELGRALRQYSRTQPVQQEQWEAFSANLHYCRGDLNEENTYKKLAGMLAQAKPEALQRNLLFYLATLPSQFALTVEQLHLTGLLDKDAGGDSSHRIVVEKPFGQDLQSAEQLNSSLIRFAHEKQIFRIDHYLGKETVQNILVFRFSNSIFEQLWNRQSVEHIQITVSEKAGVGSRGGYYEEAGALRDMVQNHLLQVLALMAMEPPVTLEAESIRDEKVKLLKSIRSILPDQTGRQAVRGQYTAGLVEGSPRPAYRQEERVQPSSNIETFVALKLFLDNWRWSGVPFYLRTGKSLPSSASEVRVQFRPTPNVLFAAECGDRLDANALTLRLQPDEGITLRFNGKIPGNALQLRPVRMHFSYDTEFGAYTPEAYERLLLEAMAGDATLFIRRDEVEAAWKIVDPIRAAWESQPLRETEFYPAGSWGPKAAEELLARRGHSWRNPQA